MLDKLQKVQADIAGGATVGQACKRLQISEQTFYRWRSQLRGASSCGKSRGGPDDLDELKVENDRLKRLVVDLALQLQTLKDEADGILTEARCRKGSNSLHGTEC